MFELGLLLHIRKDLHLTDKTIDISNIFDENQSSLTAASPFGGHSI